MFSWCNDLSLKKVSIIFLFQVKHKRTSQILIQQKTKAILENIYFKVLF